MPTVNLGRVKPIHRGAYNGATTYQPLDYLTYNGVEYHCIVTSTGNLPTDTGFFSPVVDVSTKLDALNPSYTGTLTGGTGVVNLGSGQFYKDTNGNIGLGGIAPSAWGTNWKAIEFVGRGSLAGRSDTLQFNILHNAFYDGSTFKYLSDGLASRYVQNSGVHQWSTAPSGTSGGVVTFVTSATLDAAGNLGLGVTPSAWGSSIRSIDIGFGSSITNANSVTTTWLASNAYYTTQWLYKNTAASSYYQQASGKHSWHTAPSGTAGNPISFTQAMTLDASGNLLVGTTSAIGSGYRVSIQAASTGSGGLAWRNFDSTNGGTPYVFFNSSDSLVGYISTSNTATTYNTSSDYRLKNITGAVTNSGAYIDSLNPVEGTWKADGSTFVGLIAHEVQEASRTQVATGVKDGEEMQAMDYSSSELIANMIAELKSLRGRVAQLESN